MAESTGTSTLDHIVHLTPPGSVEEVSQQFRSLGFNVIPGGTHANGLTSNALVVLSDGVYLELISFNYPVSHYPPESSDRPAREHHPWAQKEPGWIDYAFLGNGSFTTRISDIINKRATKDKSGAFYHPEEKGGRKRPDGERLEWLISNADQEKRGILPFFCGDITPRALRVPDDPSNTHHTCTARGIAHVRILTSRNTFATILKQLTTVVGSDPILSLKDKAIWRLTSVFTGGSSPLLILDTPAIEDEGSFVEKLGSGIYEIGFLVESSKPGGVVLTPHGRIVWVPT